MIKLAKPNLERISCYLQLPGIECNNCVLCGEYAP